MNRYKFILTFLAFVCLPFFLKAQFNIKVGYMLGFSKPEAHNSILQKYNGNNADWLDKQFKDLNTLHGLALGFRYKMDAVALELTFHNKYSKITAEGIEPLDDTSYYRDIYYRISSISLGYEAYFGPIGVGATIDGNSFKVNTKYEGIEKKFNVISEFGLSSHFNISYNFEASDNMSFSIRPYIHIPWTENNFFPLEEEVNGGTDSEEYKDRLINYGISLIFYNGSFY